MLTFKREFPWIGRRKVKPEGCPEGIAEPLREFVYLDEVSLGSLLASQKGEVTENITSQIGDERVAEVGAKVSANSPVLPSAEINSRFQTTNSSGLQTLRKATAQSLFREFHKIPGIRKIQPVQIAEAPSSFEDLLSGGFSNAIHSETDLNRGDLIEFKVKLSASWIFQISSMVAEFSEMFDESPMLFIENVNFSDLYQAKNANNIITKLLAGLIPVDGVVSDYVVLQYGGARFIVHKDATNGLNADISTLRVVGVTEHLAYWKDIRRVLFADNEFTMLCRLSKDGIQREWNPIKVADIFKELAPDFAKQIEVASRAAMLQSAKGETEESDSPTAVQLNLALVRYQDGLLKKINHSFTDEELFGLDQQLSNLIIDYNSAEGQRSAFSAVKAVIEDRSGQKIDASYDLELRESLRMAFNIPLFPQVSKKKLHVTDEGDAAIVVEEANLLDVEIVAIYW